MMMQNDMEYFMLNYIWLGMLIIGFVIGIINGRIEDVTKAAVNSAGKAIELSIGLLGIMCLWTGLMGIAEKSGMIKIIAKLFRPLLKLLFPEIPKKHPALGTVVMNLAANFLGLGNAATPLGLKAMADLQELNPREDIATNAMCMFLVLNTSAIQLIPATVIAIRTDAHSANPAEIIITVWIASICATIAGITAVKLLIRSENRRRYK
jgi:spore maturation protein A